MTTSTATALPTGILAIVVLAVVQMLLLRAKVFSPCTVADALGKISDNHKEAEAAATAPCASPVAVMSVTVVAESEALATELDHLPRVAAGS